VTHNEQGARAGEARGIGWIDALSARVGGAVGWLALAMVLVTFSVVVARYGFDTGWIAAQESTTWMHALMFMLGAAWALRTGDHVRVDVLYRKLSPRRQALIDLLGTLLLLMPFCAYLAVQAWPYVLQSWRIGEHSREAAGLPALYLLKSAILAMALLLMLQGSSEAVRAWRRLRAPAAAPAAAPHARGQS
jgi:TRAP-type mannitol/chloroaromatic compound transport system permease small subunit